MRAIRDQRGVAFPLALFALVMLTGLLLVFLTMGGMETSVAANLDDVTRARYVAESGLEWAFDQLVLAAALPTGWNTVLSTNSGQKATGMPLPSLGPTSGSFSVTVRNDNLPNDNLLTGQAVDPGNATNDTNRVVILTALGTYNGATRQLQQVVSHPDLTLPGGVNLPGLGTNTSFSGNAFTISGNDTTLDDSAGAGIAGICPATVWGIGVSDIPTETVVQVSLSNQQKNNVTGKPQNPGPGIGDNTITPDATLPPAQACYAMSISGTSTGAGILILEDGDLNVTGNFRWEGLIIVTGQYVGLRYGGGGNQTMYGGMIVKESARGDSGGGGEGMGTA